MSFVFVFKLVSHIKGIIGAEVDSRVLRKVFGLTERQDRVLEKPT
jgi:hypothetical protein